MKKLSFSSISSVGYLEISFSYRPRIDPVSIPYRSRIILLSFSYRSRFRKRKQYGNNTETIRKQYRAYILWKGGRYEDEA